MGLDTIETILWAEHEFGIPIPDEDTSTLLTVGEFSLYIRHQLVLKEGIKAISEPQIFNAIKNFLASQFKIKPEIIVRNAAFVKDLGLE
ncbi:hypothetical protein [Sulfurirhabdus autotrophica]|uniref:Acyl carrier protein n=1 Tax=Sulfurirhabdus autotrophica TaxID=1706046 RepID=A0A4R3Y1J7_9PROT|nr:hypothetical protein [Sulfurirhabdus autotrophica]TCV84084.1 acyl carrier protein [Sulfurirhabdus autotrophica]